MNKMNKLVKLKFGGKIRYNNDKFDHYIVGNPHPAAKFWYAQTLNLKNASEIITAANGMRWLSRQIEKQFPKFFTDLSDPEFGGDGWDLIWSAIKERSKMQKQLRIGQDAFEAASCYLASEAGEIASRALSEIKRVKE